MRERAPQTLSSTRACLPHQLRCGLQAACLGFAVFAATATADTKSDFPGLRSMMSDAEYRATGLAKLSGAERAALNRWLATYGEFQYDEAPATPAAATDTTEAGPNSTADADPSRPLEPGAAATPPRKPEPPAAEVITSRIVGEFRGWFGKTRFALENGQVWEQRSSGRYFYRATAPEVELRKNRFGFFVLHIKATGREVGVKRLR